MIRAVTIEIRPAQDDEGPRLKKIAIAAKGHWGYERMEWEAEPTAVRFYERMGGRYVRDGEPSAWGRINPIMELDLGD